MVRIVLDVVFGAFDLSNKTFGDADTVSQHGLGDLLALSRFSNGVDDVLVDGINHKSAKFCHVKLCNFANRMLVYT